MAGADIELLFGVLGGGSPSGQSGAKIQSQLNNIIGHVNKRIPGIEIKIDPGHKQNFEQELKSLTQTAREEANKIQAAYNGIVFPQIPPGGGPGGRSGGSGGINSLIKQAENAIKRMTLFRDRWTEGMNASDVSGFKPFFNYKGVIEETQDLVTQLRTGSIAVDEFVNKFALLGQVAATNEKHITNFKEVTAEIKRLEDYQNKFSAAKDNPQTRTFYNGITTQLRELERLRDSLVNNLISPEAYRSSFEQIKLVLKDAFDGIMSSGINFNQFKDLEKYHKLLGQIEADIDKIENGVSDWSALDPSDVAELERLKNLLNDIETRVKRINQVGGAFKFDIDLDNEFKAADAELKAFLGRLERSGKTFGTFGDQIFNMIDDFSAYIDLADIVFETIRMISDMKDIVTELDTAMTELRKVTDEADSTYAAFLDESSSRAQKLGATMVDVVSATADFARLGNDLDDASALADAAIIYKNVGDGIEDIDVASASIISTMQAFNIEAKDAMSIVDSFNNVGNKFAVSSAGIGEALLNSAASLAAAGNDIHESIAMIAAANTTIQNPGRVGTALKTMSMYMRAAKTEAEEAGLSTEGMAESVSQLREELLSLTGGAVDIMSDVDAGEYKSTVEMLRELSVVWKDLSDTSRTNITELIGGGVRNANIIAALMDNFSIVEDALAASVDSVGSAVAENEKYLDSIAGKIAKFNAAYESLSSSLVDSDVVKFFVDFGTVAVKSITGIIDVLGPLIAVVTAAKLINGLRNIGDVWEKLKGLERLGPLFKGLESAFSGFKGGFGGALFSTANVLTLIAGTIATILTLNKQHKEKLLANALADAEEYNEQAEALRNYKDEIASLKDTINSDASTSEEQYSARQRLLEIQNELITNYGLESSALNILTATAEEAAAAIDGLSSAEAGRKLIENASAIDAAVREMEKIRHLNIQDVNLNALPEEAAKAIKKAIDKYDSLSYDEDAFMIRITATADDAKEQLLSFSDELRGIQTYFSGRNINIADALGIYDDWGLAISDQIGYLDDALGDAQEMYNKAITWKIASKSYYDASGNLKSFMSLTNEISDAQKDLQDAISGTYDTEKERADAVYDALMRLEGLKAEVSAIAFEEGDAGVRDYYMGLFDQISSVMEKEQFRIDIVATINGEAPSSAIQEIHDHLSKFIGENGTANELDIRLAGEEVEAALTTGGGTMSRYAIHNLSEQAKLYWALASACGNYGISVDEVLSTYSQLGIVVPDVSKSIESSIAGGASSATALQGAIKNLWDSEGFADTRTELKKIAKTAAGITPKKIEELAKESEGLADVLDQDGMSAEFLAHILQEVAEGRDGFALITDDALKLNKALAGTSGILEKVTKAREKYNAAMSVTEKDDNFKSFSEAFEALNAEFVAGTTNSNKFWAAAEYIFGEDQLSEWGWADGLAQIRQAMNENISIFRNAESAGTGFLQKIQTMATATGDILDENGEAIANISRGMDGSISLELFDTDSVEKLADRMHISEEAVLACIEALSMYGDVDFRNIAEVFSAVEESGYAMEFAGKKAVNVAKLTESLRALGKTGKKIADVKSDLEEYGVTLVDFGSGIDGVISSLQSLGVATQSGDMLDINEAWLAPVLHGLALTKEEAISLIDTLGGMSNISIDKNSALAALEKYDFASATDGVNNTTNGLEKIPPVANAAKQSVEAVKKAVLDLNGTNADVGINVHVAWSDGSLDSIGSTVGVGDKTKKNGGGAVTPTTQVDFQPRATGTKHAPAGPALLGDEYSPDGSPKPELVVSEDRAYVAGINGPEIGYLNKGDVVYPADETRRILKGSRRGLTASMPAYKKGTNSPSAIPTGKHFALGGNDGSSDIQEGADFRIIVPVTYYPDTKDVENEATKSFEDLYAEHQHLLAMDQETAEEYLTWLEGAYKEAYENGEIELDAYRKYEEEVYKGRQDLVNDYLDDKEHEISVLEDNGADSSQIIGIYQDMLDTVDEEIANAYARGLTDDDDYVQDLQKRRSDINKSISELEEGDREKSQEEFDDFLNDTEHRIDMLGRTEGNEEEILGLYEGMIGAVDEEIEKARAQGLTDDDDYIQELQKRRADYVDATEEIEKDKQQKSRDAFDDYLNDTEHQIHMLEQEEGNEEEILGLYQNLMNETAAQIEEAKAAGLDSNDEYVQELESRWADYKNAAEETEAGIEQKSRDEFADFLNDTEHQITTLGRTEGNESQIINLYQGMIGGINAEINRALESGLDVNDEYVQGLLTQMYDCEDQIKNMQESAADAAKSAVDEIVNYRIDMLKQEIKDEQDALRKRLDSLRDFYDKQKEMLQDQRDEEEYLEEQAEKRRVKSDIEAEMEMLRRDDSAWAQRRLLELQEELADAEKELSDFEKDHAYENATKFLDDMYEQQAALIESEIEALDEKLNNPNALFNQALSDISGNTAALFTAMIAFNNEHGDGNPQTIIDMLNTASGAMGTYLSVFGENYKGITMSSVPTSATGYASGTRNATPGLHRVDEVGAEAVFTSADGSRYRLFSGGEKVLNANATNFLYDFANSGRSILSKIFDRFLNFGDLSKVVKPAQAIEIKTGDININGSADAKTVSEIRREQRNSIDYILKEFNRLNK